MPCAPFLFVAGLIFSFWQAEPGVGVWLDATKSGNGSYSYSLLRVTGKSSDGTIQIFV